MNFLSDCTIKTSIILCIALAAAMLLRRQSAAARHWILSAAILCAAIVPIVAIAMPSWFLRPEAAAIAFLPETYAELHLSGSTETGPVAAALPASAPPSMPAPLPALIWMTGVAIGVLVLITGWIRVARVAFFSETLPEGRWTEVCAAISQRYGLRRRIRLLRAKNPAILATWGAWRPTILLPGGSEDWPHDRVRAVLCHELAHVRRCDWLMQTTAEVLRVVYWFNPLFWIACNRLRLESEYACDDAVLAEGMAGPKYAAELLDVVRALHQTGIAWSAALSMARPSTLERRFAAMLNPRLNRLPLTRYRIAMILVAALAVTLPLATLSSSSRPENSSGRIVGIVSDSRGERAAGARVFVFAPDGRIQGTTITRVDGVFVYSGLPPGPYELQAFQSAIGSSRTTKVALQQGQELWQDIRMDIAAGNAPEPPIQPVRPHDYHGKLISMNLKKDVKAVLQSLAGNGGLEVKFEAGVSGAMAVQVKDVAWDAVLDIVLTDAGLKSELLGKTLQIAANPFVEQESLQERVVTIGGRITGFQFQNPSTFLEVEALDADGRTQVWLVRWASASQLSGEGVNADTFHAGDRVVITGAFEETTSGSRIHLIDIKRPSSGFSWGGRPWIAYSIPSDTAMFVGKGGR